MVAVAKPVAPLPVRLTLVPPLASGHRSRASAPWRRLSAAERRQLALIAGFTLYCLVRLIAL